MNSNIKGSAIGLDLGGTNLHLGIFESGELTQDWVVPFEHQENLQEEIHLIQSVLLEYFKEIPPLPIGVACAGFYDYRHHRITKGVNFAVVQEKEFFPGLAKALGSKHFVSMNDADAAALAAAYLTKASVFHITLGTGVGTALASPNGIKYCLNGMDIEMGHLEIARSEQRLSCACGSRGCMEAFFGKKGLMETCQRFFPHLNGLKDAPDSLLEEECFLEHLYTLQRFVRLIQTAFGPEMITFSGGNARLINPRIRTKLTAHCIEQLPIPKIQSFTGTLGANLGTMGAAINALQSSQLKAA